MRGVEPMTPSAGETVTKVGDNYVRTVTTNTWGSGNVGYTMYMDAAAMCALGISFLYAFR